VEKVKLLRDYKYYPNHVHELELDQLKCQESFEDRGGVREL
jgi:hypothetical protein